MLTLFILLVVTSIILIASNLFRKKEYKTLRLEELSTPPEVLAAMQEIWLSKKAPNKVVILPKTFKQGEKL